MRTVSQGLQAFLPVVFALLWFRRAGAVPAVTGVNWGMAAAVPLSVAATFLFVQSTQQALLEAVLAIVGLPAAVWFAKATWQGLPAGAAQSAMRRPAASVVVAVAAALIVARQVMEIGAALVASVQVRAADPLLAVAAGALVALTASVAWARIGPRIPAASLVAATAVFATLFTAQLAMYALHESTEARLLPFSEPMHAATEPYGPDGPFGRYLSVVLFLAPLAAAALGAGRARRFVVRPITVSGAIVLAAAVRLFTATNTERAETAPSAAPERPAAADAVTRTTSPRVVFRHTAMDNNYSRLSSSLLDARGPGARTIAGLTCERVSFAAGRGICLEADRGIFTTYKAVIFGGAFNPTHSLKLSGSPSRTRVSPDGRVGAITVFVTGQVHKYEGSDFSTRTSIVDMATGEELGELEQFATWRDGQKFKAADFNFWGVTFARDSNTFYATLATAGKTYLVQGDLGLRKLTVLKENVECPSLSPDNRLIAFKKRVARGTAPWRPYILDLATMTERPVAGEDRSIDDQIEWLDAGHVLYAVPRPGQTGRQDVWVAALDNSTAPRVFLADADSPIVVR